MERGHVYFYFAPVRSCVPVLPPVLLQPALYNDSGAFAEILRNRFCRAPECGTAKERNLLLLLARVLVLPFAIVAIEKLQIARLADVYFISGSAVRLPPRIVRFMFMGLGQIVLRHVFKVFDCWWFHKSISAI